MSTTENGWTKERPDENGIYWFKQSGMLPEVLLLHGGFVYDFGDKEPTSVGFYDGRGEWLGPLYASDFEQLAALREVGDKVVQAVEFALTTPGMIRGRNLLEVTVAALREALGDK